MTWIAVGILAVALLVLGWALLSRQRRNTDSPKDRDAASANHSIADAHGYAAQHQANVNYPGPGF